MQEPDFLRLAHCSAPDQTNDLALFLLSVQWSRILYSIRKKKKNSHIPLLTQFKYDEKQRVPNRSVRYPNNPVSHIHFFLFTNISAAFCYNDRELNGAVYYIQTSGLTRYWYLKSERLLMILDNIETKYAEYWEKSDSNGNSVLDDTVFLSYEWDTFFCISFIYLNLHFISFSYSQIIEEYFFNVSFLFLVAVSSPIRIFLSISK